MRTLERIAERENSINSTLIDAIIKERRPPNRI
jgi:hypothetical protein